MKRVIFALAALFTTVHLHAALIVNGDFESGLAGWTSSADVTTAPLGNPGQAAKLTADPVSHLSWISQIAGLAGNNYFVDFDVKMINGGGAWDGFYGNIPLIQDFGSGPTTYTHYHFAATPTTTPKLLFDFYQGAPNGAMLLDNVTIVAAPEPANLIAGIVPLLAVGFGMTRFKRSPKNIL